mmetsp:Transcript_121389/g.288420  ORF Transcript_121389/g.288420 Transcript_121389/m.288420 type:complete len:275 (+) Transcript_121389:425-1249(+)
MAHFWECRAGAAGGPGLDCAAEERLRGAGGHGPSGRAAGDGGGGRAPLRDFARGLLHLPAARGPVSGPRALRGALERRVAGAQRPCAAGHGEVCDQQHGLWEVRGRAASGLVPVGDAGLRHGLVLSSAATAGPLGNRTTAWLHLRREGRRAWALAGTGDDHQDPKAVTSDDPTPGHHPTGPFRTAHRRRPSDALGGQQRPLSSEAWFPRHGQPRLRGGNQHPPRFHHALRFIRRPPGRRAPWHGRPLRPLLRVRDAGHLHRLCGRPLWERGLQV